MPKQILKEVNEMIMAKNKWEDRISIIRILEVVSSRSVA